jgi:hypothetical protein
MLLKGTISTSAEHIEKFGLMEFEQTMGGKGRILTRDYTE